MKKLNIGRRKKVEPETEVDLTPMLSLMVAIVPLLLVSAVFFKIRIFDSSVLPTAENVMQKDGADELPVTHVELESRNKVILLVKKGEKTIFRTEKNLNNLGESLHLLTQKYPAMKSLKITSNKSVSYKDLIHVFDMAKQPTVDAKEALFEDVSLDDIFKG